MMVSGRRHGEDMVKYLLYLFENVKIHKIIIMKRHVTLH